MLHFYPRGRQENSEIKKERVRRERRNFWTFDARETNLSSSFFPSENTFTRTYSRLRCFSMQRLAFALVMSATILLVVLLALRCIIFRQFFFFMPRVSRDNEV